MAKQKSNQRHIRKTYLILVEGETELWYLSRLKKHEFSRLSNLQINIKPELPISKKFNSLLQEAKQNSKFYDRVYLILDFDVILNEYRNAIDKNKSKLNKLLSFYQNDKNKNIVILINNPCLEIWFLLHFKNISRVFQKCDDVIDDLRRDLNDYEKSENYYVRKHPDIYQRLRNDLSTAISNARSLGRFDDKDYEKTLAEMYVLLEDLGIQ